MEVGNSVSEMVSILLQDDDIVCSTVKAVAGVSAHRVSLTN